MSKHVSGRVISAVGYVFSSTKEEPTGRGILQILGLSEASRPTLRAIRR